MIQSNVRQQVNNKEQKPKADRLPTQDAGKILSRIPTQTRDEIKREHDKMLRMPRSKKFSKAIKELDVPSMEDEELMARLKEANGYAPEDEVTFTPEDMESFRRRIQVEVEAVVNNELEKQKEKEEKIKEKCDDTSAEDAAFVRDLLIPPLQDVVSKCSISGCRIHSITPKGDIVRHFQISEMASLPAAYRIADKMISNGSRWSYVEIYGIKLVHRTEQGDTIKIVYVDEEE